VPVEEPSTVSTPEVAASTNEKAANLGGLRVKSEAYCSAVVLVKAPLVPLALNWLLPKEMMDP
jgi:hypothetical protein